MAIGLLTPSRSSAVASPEGAIQMSAAIMVSLRQLIGLLVLRGVIRPRDLFDALTLAQDDINPSHVAAVSIFQQLIEHVARLPEITKE
jgi:hypothetical protein